MQNAGGTQTTCTVPVKIHKKIEAKPRMHSSRMRTVRYNGCLSYHARSPCHAPPPENRIKDTFVNITLWYRDKGAGK